MGLGLMPASRIGVQRIRFLGFRACLQPRGWGPHVSPVPSLNLKPCTLPSPLPPEDRCALSPWRLASSVRSGRRPRTCSYSYRSVCVLCRGRGGRSGGPPLHAVHPPCWALNEGGSGTSGVQGSG